MARTDAVSIELAKRRYSEALAAYTLEQWRSLAQDLGLSSNSPSSTPSAHDNALDSSDDSGSDVRINGVVNGVGAKRKNANRQDTDKDISNGLQNVTLSPGGTSRGVSLTA